MNTTIDFSPNTSISSIGGYDFYSGTLEDTGLQTTLDLHVDIDGLTYTEDFVPTTFLDNTPYTQPSIVNTDAHTVSSSRSSSVASIFYVSVVIMVNLFYMFVYLL